MGSIDIDLTMSGSKNEVLLYLCTIILILYSTTQTDAINYRQLENMPNIYEVNPDLLEILYPIKRSPRPDFGTGRGLSGVDYSINANGLKAASFHGGIGRKKKSSGAISHILRI